VPELTLPKLSRKMEDYIAGGMTGPLKLTTSMKKSSWTGLQAVCW
jgi:phage tail tube protein FII